MYKYVILMATFKLVSPKAKRTSKCSLKFSKRARKQTHALSHLSKQAQETEFLDDTEETGVACLDRFWSEFHKRGSAKYPSPKRTCKIIQSIQENDTRSYVHDKVKLHNGKLLSEMFSNYIKDAKTILNNYMKQDFRSSSSRRWFLDGERKQDGDEDIAGREFAEFLARKHLAKLPKHYTKDKGKPSNGFGPSLADPVLGFQNGGTWPDLGRVEAQDTPHIEKKTVRFKRPNSSVLDVLSVISSEDGGTQRKHEEFMARSVVFEQVNLTGSVMNKEVAAYPGETSFPVAHKYKLDDSPISRTENLAAFASYQNKGPESNGEIISNGMVSEVNHCHAKRRTRKTKQIRNGRPNGRQTLIAGRNSDLNSGGDVSNKATSKRNGNDNKEITVRKCQVRNGLKPSLAHSNNGRSFNSRKQTSPSLPTKASETNRSTASSVHVYVSGKPLQNETAKEMLPPSQADQYDKPFNKTNDKQMPKTEAVTSKEAKQKAPNAWNKTLRIMRDISLSSSQQRSWEEADYSKLSKFLGVTIAKLPVKGHTLLRNDTDSPTFDVDKSSAVPERVTSDRGHYKGVSSPVMRSRKSNVLETGSKKQVLLQRPTLKKYDSLGVGKTAEVTKLSQFVRYEFDIPEDLDANLEHLSLHGYLHG